MNNRDRSKVRKAGFRVFRVCYSSNTITESTGVGAGGWKKHSEHPTKAATKRAFMELMKDTKNLED